MIRNPESGGAEIHAKAREDAALVLGITLRTANVRRSHELDQAFDALRRERVDGLFVANTPLTATLRDRILAFAAANRLPALYDQDSWTRAGGLASYGVDLDELVRRTAGFVDRVLKGAKPAELPIELPTKFRLVVNRGTAKTLGVTIPPSVLARADEVIE